MLDSLERECLENLASLQVSRQQRGSGGGGGGGGSGGPTAVNPESSFNDVILQMTWKSCSVDDIESIKDILSPP